MDADEPGWPMIDDVFRDLAVGRSTATVRRYLRVRARLYAFLDTADLREALGAEASAVLHAARRQHDTGAFWAVLGVDELARCLPVLVTEPWLPDGSAEARVHLSVVSRLAGQLTTSPGRHDVDAAVDAARRQVAVRPSRPEPQTMPDRFLRRPGPTW
jgi:hypothetical protein